MSSYDFIVDNIRYSYSSVSGFETCPYSFKLSRIEGLPSEDNFYAEYGKLMHTCIEKYFNGEIDIFELSQYYEDNYDFVVKTSAPPSAYDLGEKYRRQGREFFDSFSFNRENYIPLIIEEKIDFDIDDCLAVARPDLVLQEKSTGLIGLYDYKTSSPFWTDKSGKEKKDEKKLKGYYKQLYIYTYALRTVKDIKIDKINLWFTRPERLHSFDWNQSEEKETIAWFLGVIKKIKEEEVFPYNNSDENNYFCNNLCGVRSFCEYR